MAADKAIISDGPVYMPVEQYLALDDNTDGQYEYWHGIVVMLRPPSSAYLEQPAINMAGGSLAHAAICARLASLIDQALPADSPCLVYSSDVKLKLAKDHYLHPDLAISCSEQEEKLLTNPTVIIDVLSPNTEERDRNAKLETYKRIASIQEYMMVGSTAYTIEVHRREGKGNIWRTYHYQEGDLVELISIGVSFSFGDVYKRIKLA